MKHISQCFASGKRLLASARYFLKSEHASAMPFIALGVLMLTGATGTAIDMGRVQIVQTRMQTALDAAGLAVGSEIHTANLTTETSKYFYANFPANYLGTTINTLTAVPNSTNTLLTLSVAGTVNTTFMKLFGINTVNVSATSQITLQTSGMELVLVLDNTGSMNYAVDPGASSTTKIVALKSAATQLLSILYGGANTVPNLWVGVVPFSQAVNIGTGYPGWMDTTFDSNLDFGPTITGTTCQTYSGTSPTTAGTYSAGPKCAYAITSTTNHNPPITNFGPTNWGGCVMARPAPYDTSDDPPSVSLFQAYDFLPVPTGGTNYDPWMTSSTTSNKVGSVTTYKTTSTYNYSLSGSLGVSQGPNALCSQVVQPMVAEQSTIVSAINSMVAEGDTALDLGLVWGWRMLSPRWQGLWGGEMNTNNLPLAYNTPLINKVVVFMTDGMNRFIPGDYSGYGFLADNQLGTTTELTAEEDMDTRTLAVCSAMKANGIVIYTIGFGNASPDNPPTESDRGNELLVDSALLKSCATDASHFFLAPTNAELAAAFQQIGDSLANLRVSQ